MMTARPEVGFVKVTSMRMVVVFPAPFGPTAQIFRFLDRDAEVIHRADLTLVDLREIERFNNVFMGPIPSTVFFSATEGVLWQNRRLFVLQRATSIWDVGT